MKYIDLSAITADHVLGKWEVIDRMVNTQSEGNLFSDIRMMELKVDSYTSINGQKRKGVWSVIRENEIIYNPQLKFFIDGAQVGNAIITRLMLEGQDGAQTLKLTLYFNTGLELVLHRQSA